MASPATENVVTNNTWHASSSTTITLSTTTSGDLAVVVIGYENSAAQRNVTGVTSANLTFTKRTQKTTGASNHCTAEIWTAPVTGTLSSEVITVQTDGNIDGADVVAFGVKGLNSSAAPWDSNAGLPDSAIALSASQSAAVTYSTTQADDLILAVWCGNKSGSQGGLPAGWTTVAQILNSAGVQFCGLGVATKSVSAAQSGSTFPAAGSSSGCDFIAVVDAFTADSASVSVNLTGVAGTGAAHAVVPQASKSLSGVAAAGAAAALGKKVEKTPSGASGTGAAGALGVTATGTVLLNGIAAQGHAGAVAAHYSSNVALAGAHATGAAGAFGDAVALGLSGAVGTGSAGAITPKFEPSTNFPVFRLMRDTPVATVGAMGDTPVACIGRLRASGPQPRSTAVDLAGVSATGHAATVSPYRNVSVTLAGVAAAGAAGAVTPA